MVCRIGSLDSQFFLDDFLGGLPSSVARELCTAFRRGGARQFMPGSSASMLNLLEFQSMARLR
jgi:hypothetical protein